ncbi:MAG TPA: prolyl oligopeptidase family serine peptidase [Chitinophagaceae bacterium]|nr:prolyl oligopeptidase family serine peptidase [Chitinophagaceae bacterium]
MRYFKPTVFILLSFLISQALTAQKKPLDHTVYDGWQAIGEKLISNDGRWVVYTVDPQEGDNELVIQTADGRYKKVIPRGYNADITEDSRYLICKIKPFFKDTREAKIKKKKPEDTPTDSLTIVRLGIDSSWKAPRVKSFLTPKESFGWVAYQLEKPIEPPLKGKAADSKKTSDSLTRIIDSLRGVLANIPAAKQRRTTNKDDLAETDADGDETPATGTEVVGTELVLRNLERGESISFRNVVDYYFSTKGTKLLLELARNPKDTASKAMVLLYDLRKGFADTLSVGGNEFKNFAMTDDGSQVAFVAEREAKPKALQKFYTLWYFKEGMDSATLLVDKANVGMKIGMTVSEFGNVSFSKNGQRILFATAPIQPPKDTTLVEMDLAKLDVWHYNDDYLQTQQLNRLQRDLQQNYLAVYHLGTNKLEQLGSEQIPTIYTTDEGNGNIFIGVSDFGKRVESQWTGNTRKDIYAMNVNDGSVKLVKKDLKGVISPSYISSTGRYIFWYDSKAKNYFVYDGDSTRNLTSRIKTPLYEEDNDVPDEPGPYGVMGWQEGDSAVYVYDRYDIWKLSMQPGKNPENILAELGGRETKTASRYVSLDPEKKFVKLGEELLIRQFNDKTKKTGYALLVLGKPAILFNDQLQGYSVSAAKMAKQGLRFIYTKENYTSAPDLFVSNAFKDEVKLSSIDQQQKDYNWGTAELYHWTTFKGKPSDGILYKPENFDPTKKYPLILYFYEKLSDGLYNYLPPAPTPSRLNIPFFVSRGYLVFAPDISYTIGHPAQSAYDYIVSAAKDLAKNSWVDAANMGIQGQSWGGIQVAQLVTMTDIFKAAWAGAPVANMTSAYGGIRWESGNNRQSQYERTQSRIGATLWEHPELYIESSPLFHLPKVRTPLVIMSNDADGAVPWYQGIEMFTAMRRLGKKVWLLNYNGEAHNLVLRRNRKDIQIREQQYFDWMLKGAKPAKWLTEGIPAVRKGRDWGLDLVE